MRGTQTPQPRGLFILFSRSVNPFPLAALLACAAVISGCASVAANDSRIAAKIAVVPESVQFHEVVVGQENSQTLRVTNTSTEPIQLEALHITGKGFSVASGRSPVVLIPGKSALFTVAFTPVSAASVAGALEITTANLGTFNVPLEGSGEKAAPQLQASPSMLNFGMLPVHSAAAQTVTLKNAGNVAITINSVGLPSSAFSISGLSSGSALAPGQSLQFRVTFQPSTTGAASSGITINSSSLSSPVRLAVSGSGSSPTAATSTSAGSTSSTSASSTPASPTSGSPLSVKLSWNASTSSVVGYHVYRGSASGGPYSRISGSTITALGYEDATVQAGARYYYVVSALDGSGDESSYSNEAAADVPNQ